jgi:choline dehydrogenase-like flavoprotein
VGLGGGTNFYDGDSPRVQQTDLRLRSTLGPIAGADLVDWPLSYEELEPYYDATEALIGVQGLAGADPFAMPRKAYPMPPGAKSKLGELLTGGARRLGYHPHPMPNAINSVPYRGRPACQNAGFCNIGCPTNAKGSTAVTAIREAKLTGNLTVLLGACATKVETEPSGARASAVVYLDADGNEQRITGEKIILALNAIETPRLLLASASASHPNGLGNSSGRVGRCLMFHMTFSSIGVFDEPIKAYRSRTVAYAMADFTQPVPGTNLRGGYVELGGSIHPVAEGVQYPWIVHAQLFRSGTYRNNIAAVSMMGEDLPVLDNRVDLDPSVKDIYGRPVARVTWARHPRDQAVVDYYMPRLSEIAKAAGAKSVMEVDDAKREGTYQTKHLLGSTRMGTDASTSVTDEWGRMHDLENVWICDGGVFPTSTAFNPTLTQQALAWRTAVHLAGGTEP